ncbi:MAG: hypothetical protein U5K55_17340 [Aliarcobacter sp.]|nr:hypothetical protein [Aliarcobacter sp.]
MIFFHQWIIKKSGYGLSRYCDYEEVQWQAVAIAKTFGLVEECPDFTIELENQVSDSKTLSALLNLIYG